MAVIRASAVNQDGASSGLTVPNGLAQQALIRKALESARIDAGQIGYVEAHGTGTNIGDPIEIEAIGSVLCRNVERAEPLRVGSVKTNLGHMESASGIGGLIKAALCLERESIPRSLHFETPNPRIDWHRFALEVPTKTLPWPRGDAPRFAGVSGFGFSGTNGHLILEEAPRTPDANDPVEDKPVLLCLSARTPAALDDLADRYADWFETTPRVDVADACCAATTRAPFSSRLAVVARSVEDFGNRLRGFRKGDAEGRVLSGQARTDSQAVHFLFTGQGSQYSGMGAGLYEQEPVFRNALDRCSDILRPSLEHAIRDVMFDERHSGLLNQTAYTQPALFALEWALAELWRAWGLAPSAVLGHSVGEYVAACVANIMTLEDGLKLLAKRAQLMQSLPSGGGMTSVLAPEAEVLRLIDGKPELGVAAVNSPETAVISGSLAALREIERELQERSIRFTRLEVSHAFHSPLMEPILDAFREAARQVEYRDPSCLFLSNVTGQPAGPREIDAEYWVRHVRQPVRFADCVAQLPAIGVDILLELGPSPVLLALARQCLPDFASPGLPSLRPGKGAMEQMLESLGSAWVSGCRVNLDAAVRNHGRRRPRLPTYPFQRKRYWLDDASDASVHATRRRVLPEENLHPLLGRAVSSPLKEIQFECSIDVTRTPVLREHRIAGVTIFPAAAFIELGCAAARKFFDSEPSRIEDGWLQSALVLDEEGRQDIRLVVTPTDGKSAEFAIYSRSWNDAPGEPWSRHAGGRLVRSLETGVPDITREAARTRCTASVDLEPWRLRIAEVGLEYGPTFRSLVKARRGKGEAYGELQLPSGDPLVDRLGAHPGMLDSAFHLIGIALDPDDATSDRFYLPVGYEAAEITSPLGCEATVHVSIRNVEPRRVIADVTVWGNHEFPSIRIRGLTVRSATREQFQAIVQTSRSELLRMLWQPVEAATPRATDGDWYVLGGDPALSTQVVAGMAELGARVTAIEVTEADRFLDLLGRDCPQHLAGIIDLGNTVSRIDTAVRKPTEELAGSAVAMSLSLLRALATTSVPLTPTVVIVTERAQYVDGDEGIDPLPAVIWGMAGTASAELPNANIRLIDVDNGSTSAAAVIDAALREDDETRLAVRSKKLFAPRLEQSGRTASNELERPAGPYSLEIATRGTLSGLAISGRHRSEPGPGQVEIEVLASGLNFRDVLNLLDMYPGAAGSPGNECCGRVVRTGSGVEDIQPGMLVNCIADATFSSHVIAEAAMVFPVPATLSIAQAATFPIAQLTAYYALYRVGNLKSGQHVLIHAGAGGVGLAAVHLAHAAGATVLATAGSEEKRRYLTGLGVARVFDSRQTLKAATVLEATAGQGVDLLLNSLTGEAIDEGLRSLAAGGRFLEIGLRELRTDADIRAIRDDVTYHPLLLGDLCVNEPHIVREMYASLTELLGAGRIPPPAIHSFPIRRVEAAFRFLAKARHIGRVAVTHPAADHHVIRGDAAYLVTGGLGALGLHTAGWLANRGARTIVLLGRGEATAAATDKVDDLRKKGVDVKVMRGDVSNVEDLAFLGSWSGPPLRGVFHAAGVLDDATLAHVDLEHLARVMRPKADGVFNISGLTRSVDLDVFVLYSSAAAVFGSPGQSAYAGANAFLDAIACQLHLQGRAAVSINWGAWQDGGMATRVDERVVRDWEARGIGALSTEEATGILDAAPGLGLPQLVAHKIDWHRFSVARGSARVPAILKALMPKSGVTRDGSLAPGEFEQLNAGKIDGENLPDYVLAALGAVLGAQVDQIDPNKSMSELGFDSLMAMELRNRLQHDLGVAVPVSELLAGSTPAELMTNLAAMLVVTEAPAPRPGEALIEGEI
jgi:acyl transferase domain-containing protein/acyl carrier protein/NADP-dependent 3-hydroxy acid dehydrogenase YdfG